ncbi:MAG TPA: hypothetical protein VI078_17160 [bacterium]
MAATDSAGTSASPSSSLRRRALLGLLSLLLGAAPAFGESAPAPAAAEPAFCVPGTFLAHEVPGLAVAGVSRLRVFRLGPAVLAGMAIGDSDAAAVARLAEGHGATSADRYCTWYVNKGNREAAKLFRHVYLPNPRHLGPRKAADEYGELFGPALGPGPDAVWGCLEQRHYVAVGCNGQQHRGPTAFGMVLAALGCEPEHAAEIVNHLWGLNGVPEANRLAAIRRAYEIGASQPDLRARLQRLFGGAN